MKGKDEILGELHRELAAARAKAGRKWQTASERDHAKGEVAGLERAVEVVEGRPRLWTFEAMGFTFRLTSTMSESAIRDALARRGFAVERLHAA